MSIVLQGFGPSSGTGSGTVVFVPQPTQAASVATVVRPGIVSAAAPVVALGLARAVLPRSAFGGMATVTIERAGAVISIETFRGAKA